MSYILTTNMSLIVPTVGGQDGPTYAENINSDLSIIDNHDHTPGNGVQITTAGLNINSSLTLNNNLLTSIKGLVLSTQLTSPGINTIYESGVDLYYTDGLGNNVRITQNGGIAGSPGSISNLTAPASAAYVSANNTFVWQSNTSTAANMDCGSVIIRETTASANGVTLSSPSALASSYTLTMPTALPASTKIMQLSSSGQISSVLGVDNTTIEISGNNLQVKDASITNAKLASNSVATANIQNLSVTKAKLANDTGFDQSVEYSGTFSTSSTSFVFVSNGGNDVTISTLTTGRPLFVGLQGRSNLTSYIGVGGTATVEIYCVEYGFAVGSFTIQSGYNDGVTFAMVDYPPSSFSAMFVPGANTTLTFKIRVKVSSSLMSVRCYYTELYIYSL